jgi:UDP-N-acetylmuramoyl-L-alanyl-D-glutamate--2,6-diaminopimelate ligase
MRVLELLPDLEVVDVGGDVHRDVARVTRDSRDVGPNAVFVAIKGSKVDGHDLVAAAAGAAAIVIERTVAVPDGVAVIRVNDTKRALAMIAAALSGHPGRAVRVAGITGTKGKTTTAALVEGVWLAAGRKAGRVGTTGASFDGQPLDSDLTTPEAPELQALLAKMRAQGGTDAVIEVSSIGLVQRRVDGIPFHVAAFTNLGRDHLDFHGSMAGYQAAKSRLFRELLRPAGGMPRAVLSADDPASDGMHAPADRWTSGLGANADIRAEILDSSAAGLQLRLHTPLGTAELTSRLVGRHNAQNLACAAAIALCHGVPLDAVAAGLASVRGVPGRLETVPNDRGILVAVDYAHTPESLAAVLTALREVTTGELWCVFGCGGDRDPGKRPVMGEVVGRLADHAVVTSDNPRSEDPRAIVDAILSGMANPAHVDVDRAAAIRWTLVAAAPGDVVLLAGKGHETYQEIAGIKHPFDDREVARAALEGT